MNENREIMQTVRSRKTNLFVHLIRHNEFLKAVIEGSVAGRELGEDLEHPPFNVY